MDRFLPQCYPCALRRALCTAEKVSDDEWLQHKVIDEAMRQLAEVEGQLPAAEVVGELLLSVNDVLGTGDPWKEDREKWFGEMVEAMPDLRDRVLKDADPLGRALLLSARSNVFANEILSPKAMREDLLKLGLREPKHADVEFKHEDRSYFDQLLSQARRFVFIHDTAPEVPADMVLLEQIQSTHPDLEILQMVKSSKLTMNALSEHVSALKMESLNTQIIEIEAGLGISTENWPTEVESAMKSADLILSKGASHFQMLQGHDLPLFGLFRAKCPVTASIQQCSIGDLLLVKI